jgi:hypothetical protein
MDTTKTKSGTGRRLLPRVTTLQDAAAETGVPYTSLRDLVLSGALKRVQLGDSRRIWVRASDLERLINEQP